MISKQNRLIQYIACFLLVLVFFSQGVSAVWTAYNDAGDNQDANCDSHGYVTNIGGEDGSPPSGELVKYADNSGTGVTLQISGTGLLEGHGAEQSCGAGACYPPSGDAATEFGEVINVSKISYTLSPNDITVTLSGVSNTKTYTLVVLGQRGNSSYSDRWCNYTISNVDNFTAASSAGTNYYTISLTDDRTEYNCGDNYNEGYVAKWTSIAPTSDTITVTISGNNKRYVSAVKLMETAGDDAPSVSLNSPADASTTNSTSVVFNCSATDDNDLDNITLYGNWSGGWHANETKTLSGVSDSETFTKTLADEQSYDWNCMACDNNSNCTLAAANHTLTVNTSYDSVNPSVTLNSPADGANLTNTSVTFNCTGYDDRNLSNITLYFSSTGGGGGGVGWTAYNDLSGGSSGNVTSYTTQGGESSEGYLRNYATGENLSVYFSVSGPAWADVWLTQGGDANSGTDAYDIFYGKIDGQGVLAYTGDHVFTFTGLDPNKKYRLVHFGNRHEAAYTDRTSKVVLSDVDSFEVNSSSGVTISTTSVTNDSATYVTGYNTVNGYVAGWTNIDPGADGDFTVTVVAGYNWYSNALMLQDLSEETSWHANEMKAASGTEEEVTFAKTLTSNMTYTWNCLTVDLGGNQNWSASNYTFTVNESGPDTGPSVSLNSPQDSNISAGTTVVFNCSATDDNDLDNITLYGSWGGGWHANETKTLSGTSDSETFTKTLADGQTYDWNCMACDNNSNCTLAAANYTLTVNTSYDTVNPNVMLNSPQNGTNETSTTVVFNCTATDNGDLINSTLYLQTDGAGANVTASFRDNGATVNKTEDSSIYAASPDTNNGSAAGMDVDGAPSDQRALIKFPNIFGNGAGQIPSGATIVEANLTLYNDNDVGNNSIVYIVRENWTEDEVTWNSRLTGTAWTDAGVYGSTSCDTSISASTTLGTASQYDDVNVTEFVQNWSDGAQNYGFLVYEGGISGITIASSEHATAEYRPKLTVVYSAGTAWHANETKAASGREYEATFARVLSDNTTYTWNCLAFDANDNSAWATANGSFTVNTSYTGAAPGVTLNSPANESVNTSTSITFNCTATDENKLVNVTLYGNWSGGWHANETRSVAGKNAATVFTKTLADGGDYTWNCLAFDSESQSTFATANYSLTIDASAPSIQLTPPTTSSGVYPQNWISANVSASDDNLDSITISLFNGSGLVDYANTNSSSTLYANFTGLSDGTYYLNATANDTLGRSNATETRTIILDNSAPEIQFVSPTTPSGAIEQDWIAINVTASDQNLDEIVVSLYNASGLVSSGSSSTSPVFLNTTGLSTGTYYVNASANDTVGNAIATETKVIILANTTLTVEWVNLTTVENTTATETSTFDNLSCENGTVVNSEGGEVTLAYRWYKNGFEQPQTTKNIPSDLTSIGEMWVCTLVFNNSEITLEQNSSAVIIQLAETSMQTSSDSTIYVQENVVVWTYYTDSGGSPLLDATCSSTGGVSATLSDAPTLDGNYTYTIAFSAAGTRTYQLSCAKADYAAKSGVRRRITVQNHPTTIHAWEDTSYVGVGGQVVFTANYTDARTNQSLAGATCILRLDATVYLMSETPEHVYQYTRTFTEEGTYTAYVMCTKEYYDYSDMTLNTVFVGDLIPHQSQLDAGWNLISIPLQVI